MRRLVVALLALIIGAGLLTGGSRAAEIPVVFNAGDGNPEASDFYIRQRSAIPDVELFPAPANNEGTVQTKLRLNLFAGHSYVAVLRDTQQLENGSVSWTGTIAEVPKSEVSIVVGDGRMRASVHAGPHNYEVFPSSDGLHVIGQTNDNAEAFEDIDSPIEVEAPTLAADGPISLLAADDGSIIDLLVVYTPAAAAARGGDAGMRAEIDAAVLNANTAYANSDVIPRLRLVHAEEVTYTSAGFNADLTRLQAGTNGLDGVHTLRDAFGADIVSLINTQSDSCGLGFVMGTESASFASHAFNVVALDCMTGYLSLAHEIGHNMGLAHDRAASSSAPLKPYGYGFVDSDKAWRTVMAYGTMPRIAYFANSAKTYAGRPMGIASGTKAAEDYRAINDVRVTVANFRATVLTPPVFHAFTGTVVGRGKIIGSGLRCKPDCTSSVIDGTSLTLTARPGRGQRFAGWSGPCAGEPRICVITGINADVAETATFRRRR